MSLPTDSKARKRIPMFSGLMKYFPDALAAVAEVSFEGNEKHNPGEPLHWAREKSNDHLDCIIRHMADVATGSPMALREVAWRALAQLQLEIEASKAGAVARVYRCSCNFSTLSFIEFDKHVLQCDG